MGARGNSGVILSQIWQGLAQGLQEKKSFDGSDLANALLQASTKAYEGISKPVPDPFSSSLRLLFNERRDPPSALTQFGSTATQAFGGLASAVIPGELL